MIHARPALLPGLALTTGAPRAPACVRSGPASSPPASSARHRLPAQLPGSSAAPATPLHGSSAASRAGLGGAVILCRLGFAAASPASSRPAARLRRPARPPMVYGADPTTSNTTTPEPETRVRRWLTTG